MPLNVSDKINSNIDADLVSFKQFQKTNIYDFNLSTNLYRKGDHAMLGTASVTQKLKMTK